MGRRPIQDKFTDLAISEDMRFRLRYPEKRKEQWRKGRKRYYHANREHELEAQAQYRIRRKLEEKP